MLKLSLCLLAVTLTACKKGSVNTPSTPPPLDVQHIQLTDYQAGKVSLTLRGIARSNLKALDTLEIFTDASCSGDPVGTALVSDFSLNGIEIELIDNKKRNFYVGTRHSSDCKFIVEYQPQLLVPRIPIFTMSSPESPSRDSYTPGLFGYAFPTSGTVEFFTDSSCTVKVGEGTALDYLNVGVQVTLQDNFLSTIYGRTTDTLGQPSGCGEVTSYYHTDGLLQSPVFTSITPNSPNKDSAKARVFGDAGPDATLITLYCDSACSQVLSLADPPNGSISAVGTPQEFASTGFEFDVPTNFTTLIYAKSRDDSYTPSKCVYLTSYTHDNIPPDDPAYTAAAPPSPTRLTLVPKISGTSSSDTVTVAFFDSNLCLNQRGVGSKLQFESTGISVTVAENSITTIYAKSFDMAGNGSSCTYLTDYKHNIIPPDHPVFLGTTPPSPTNQSTTPKIYGAASPTMVSLSIYNDENCANFLASGTSAEFEDEGVLVTAGANQVTDFYARATDPEGNISQCEILGSYDHSSLPAADPVFFMSSPPSPSRTSSTPWIIGVANSSFTQVQFFSDNLCTVQVGAGPGGSFGAGIPATLSANATTDIYAISTDKYGNQSGCAFLTTYVHTNIPPENPVFTDVSPASPNNVSYTPTLTGYSYQALGSQLPPSRVDFFDSLLCINRLGYGTPAEFVGAGITITVPQDSPNMIYGRSVDEAGNQSGCVHMVNYTHNSLKPGAPIFTAATPASPSYTPESQLKGTFGFSSDFMNRVSMHIYSDSECSVELASAAPALWTSTGIPTPLPQNQITQLYGATFNEVGTKSNCSALTNFRHHDLPLTGLNLNSSPNGAILVSWIPDITASPNPTYTVERSLKASGPYSVIQAGGYSTSFADLSVTEGESYNYRIFASNNTGRGQYSEVKAITVNAPPPVDVATLIATPGSSAVILDWNGFPQNMTYKVFRSLQEGGPFAQIAATSVGSYIDYYVTNNVAYYYIVKGQNPSGISIQSNMASAVPLAAPEQPLHLSLEPMRNMVECSGNSGLHLSWNSPSYYQSFDILQGTGINNKGQVKSAGGTHTTICDLYSAGNDNNNNYFAVRSRWGTDYSNESNVVGFYNINAPTFAAYAGDEEIQLTWNPPTGGNPFATLPARFDVYKSEFSTGPFVKIVEDTQSTGYLDLDVVNGKGYFYYIQAYTINNDGVKNFVGWPSVVQGGVPGVAPPAPENLRLTLGSMGEPRLEWTAPSHFNGFSVQRASDPGGPYLPLAWTLNPYLMSVAAYEGMNYYRVTARWGSQETAPTNVVSFRQASLVGLAAQVDGEDIQLSWIDVFDVADYEIFRSLSPLDSFVSIGTSVSANFTDPTTSEDVGYYYRVVARFSDATVSPPSSIVGISRGATMHPKGLSLEALPGPLVMARWVPVPGITSYDIYVSEALPGPYTKKGSTAGSEFLLIGLDPATEYFVYVRAKQGVNDFDSDPASVTTFERPSPPLLSPGDGFIQLTWSTLPEVESFDIERSTDGVSFSAVASSVMNTIYSDNTVANGTLYFYRLKANYSSGSTLSDSSLGVRPGVIPRAPQGLSAANNNTGTQVELSWVAEPGATRYFIYSSSTSGVYGTPIQSSTTHSKVLVTGLTGGDTYYFSVSSVRGEVESGLSNEVSIVPGLNLQAPTVSMDSATGIKVSWLPVLGADVYDIYRSPNGGWFERVGQNVSDTEFIDNTVDPDITYYYKYNPLSATGTVYPPSNLSLGALLGIKPQVPQQFRLSAQTTSAVELRWIGVPNVVTYSIYRSTTSGGPYTLVDEVPFTVTATTDSSVVPGQEYFYVLRSVNAAGVLSDESQEVSVNLVAPPASLIASFSNGSVDLSWSASGGASSYIVRRSELTGGPYGQVGISATNSYEDSDIEVDRTYYYVVEAVYPSGSISPQSDEATVLSEGSLSLVVPVELLDVRASSFATEEFVIEASQTHLDTNYYDGTVTYSLEIIASNTDGSARSVHLINESDAVVDSLAIPPGTVVPTRFSAVITPHVGSEVYRLKVDQTTSDFDLTLRSARILIHQVDPTRTRLYFPLLALSGDAEMLAAAVSTNSAAFSPLALSIPFLRDTTKFSRIIDFNAWEIEALVSTSLGADGSFALINRTTSGVVPRTQTTFDTSEITLARVPFSEGDTGFGSTEEGNLFEVSVRCDLNCDTGQVHIHKAGLWLTLENLTRASVHFRNAPLSQVTADEVLSELRSLVDPVKFSSPKFYFEAVGSISSGGSAQVSLVSTAAESGSGGATDVADSTLIFTEESKTIYRTASDISIGAGQRTMTKVQVTAPDELELTCSSLVVEVGSP